MHIIVFWTIFCIFIITGTVDFLSLFLVRNRLYVSSVYKVQQFWQFNICGYFTLFYTFSSPKWQLKLFPVLVFVYFDITMFWIDIFKITFLLPPPCRLDVNLQRTTPWAIKNVPLLFFR